MKLGAVVSGRHASSHAEMSMPAASFLENMAPNGCITELQAQSAGIHSLVLIGTDNRIGSQLLCFFKR